MATKKVGTLVKEARTAAGLTQEQLARKVTGIAAADISKLERGEVDFTQAQLKQVAKACGVTQSSLINAPKNLGKTAAKTTSSSKSSTSKSTSSKSTSSKSTSSRSTSSKSTASKSTSASKGTSSASKSTASKSTGSKSSSSSGTSMKVSASERKLIELYREADSNTKKFVTSILKGEMPEPEPLPDDPFRPFPGAPADAPANPGDILGSLIMGALEALGRR